MFVKTLVELKANGKEVAYTDGKLRAVDFLTKSDGLGFTVSDVRCAAGLDEVLWYKHHWEANYIVEGKGTLEEMSSGQSWSLEPEVIFTVGPKDRHRFRAEQDLHVVSIFNPPLIGTEEYDEDGSFESSGKVLPGRDTMFVKRLDELRADGREKVVAGGSARSIRILLQEDRVGFTLCDVRLAAGNRNVLWYKHHWEANYILHGQGKVCDLTTGECWPMEPGMMYIVGPEDRHSMEAHTDLHLISVFNPALQGDEQHDEEGTIPASGPLPPGMSPK
ncbi:MAG: ectoine synthase [Gammaproteobacteria bacterium]|nr:ectoine synthase [Gammaproteobacteria bacterium]